MGSIFGGGGSGKSTTTASNELPAELKPLAAATVPRIQATQDALPLAQFATPQPQQVAGLSPFQVAGMQLVPGTAEMSAPMQQLGGMPAFWNDLTQQALDVPGSSQIPGAASSFLMNRAVNPPNPLTMFNGNPFSSTSAQDPSAWLQQFARPPQQSSPGSSTTSPQIPQLAATAPGVFGAQQIPSPQIPPWLTQASIPITPLQPTMPIPSPAGTNSAASASSMAPMQVIANPYGPPGSILTIPAGADPAPYITQAYSIASDQNAARQNEGGGG